MPTRLRTIWWVKAVAVISNCTVSPTRRHCARCTVRTKVSLTFDLFFLAAKTGARQGELLKLTWDAIDCDANELTYYDTKNGDDRVLPMTPDLRGLLKRMKRQRIDDDKLFTMSPKTALNRLRKIQSLLGISTKKDFHTFRHTAATQMFANGAALPEVQEVLGHRNATTTMRYSHATLEGKKRALALL